jgi:hypothetical protein
MVACKTPSTGFKILPLSARYFLFGAALDCTGQVACAKGLKMDAWSPGIGDRDLLDCVVRTAMPRCAVAADQLAQVSSLGRLRCLPVKPYKEKQ